ncbi:MAG: hypothetical protein P8Z37_11850 [Acidobacteriota bacterium]|jgi:hypothetical protein
MMHKLRVEEHLRNGALYTAETEPSTSIEWKHRLLNKCIPQQPLKAALIEKPHIFRLCLCIGVPALAMILGFSIFFGFIGMEPLNQFIASLSSFDIPAVGLKEALVFVGIMNIWTLFALRKRFASLF